jgi:branched-chain amino acid transport system ATP-binding protein
MLEVREMKVNYGPVRAVDGASLRVNNGEIVALVGTNGAGKTSLLKAVMGLVSPASGVIVAPGDVEVQSKPAHWIARNCKIAYVAEDRNIFSRLSVRENVLLGLYIERKRDKKWIAESLDRVYTLFPRLQERLNQTAGTLSGGEQQMVVMARALVSRPRLLLLDEPSLGLAPMMVESIFERLDAVRGSGTGVLLVEQNSQIAFEVSDRGYVMESGRIALEGTADALSRDPRVRDVYLGLAATP